MRRKTLLVTGASADIGAATVQAAAAESYDTFIINYRSDRASADTVAQMVNAQGCEAVVIRADITDPAAVAAMFEQITALPPAALNLVNNAGIVAPKASIKDLTPDRVSAVFSLNVAAAIEVARHAVAYMRAHHGGGIVNVSSTAARKGMAHEYIDYAASKAAIETFTLGLADELAPEGIRVNAVRPGLIETGIHAKGGVPDCIAQFAHTTPMGRAGTAQEVAKAILWLLSNEASYTTRSILDVAGGR